MEPSKASFLLSIIGIINVFGRILCGYIADFPSVDSLLLNNICLVISTFAVGLTPLCSSYTSYIIVASFFAVGICKFGIFRFILQMFKFFSCFRRLHLTHFHYLSRFTGLGKVNERFWLADLVQRSCSNFRVTRCWRFVRRNPKLFGGLLHGR